MGRNPIHGDCVEVMASADEASVEYWRRCMAQLFEYECSMAHEALVTWSPEFASGQLWVWDCFATLEIKWGRRWGE